MSGDMKIKKLVIDKGAVCGFCKKGSQDVHVSLDSIPFDKMEDAIASCIDCEVLGLIIETSPLNAVRELASVRVEDLTGEDVGTVLPDQPDQPDIPTNSHNGPCGLNLANLKGTVTQFQMLTGKNTNATYNMQVKCQVGPGIAYGGPWFLAGWCLHPQEGEQQSVETPDFNPPHGYICLAAEGGTKTVGMEDDQFDMIAVINGEEVLIDISKVKLAKITPATAKKTSNPNAEIELMITGIEREFGTTPWTQFAGKNPLELRFQRVSDASLKAKREAAALAKQQEKDNPDQGDLKMDDKSPDGDAETA